MIMGLQLKGQLTLLVKKMLKIIFKSIDSKILTIKKLISEGNNQLKKHIE